MTDAKKPEHELKPEDKAAVNQIYKGILSDIYNETADIKDLYENKIPGVVKRIQNPVYEITNGNGNGDDHYINDFPSWYQVEAVEHLRRRKRVLIADEMGLGKTAQAVVARAAIESDEGKPCKTLVVCPNTAKSLWYERICDPAKGYFEKEYVSKLNVVQLDEYTTDALDELKKADIAIINYDSLSFSGDEGSKANLKRAIMESGFRYVVLDEAHNAKNPSSQAYRSKHVKDIADRADYLALLTGTPIPNTLSDTYMMIALLEPRRKEKVIERVKEGDKEVEKEIEREVGYKDASEVANAYSQTPSLIRAVLNTRMLRREMKDVYKLPDLVDKPYDIQLSPEQDAIYKEILDNCELEGSYKLQQLKRALLDPSLVNPDIIDDKLKPLLKTTESAKYLELDKIINENAARGEKTIVFSPLWREGVTKKLEKRYKAYGSLRMDGTNANEREDIRKRFQHEDAYKVLIATDVAGEGISLAAANNIAFLDDPYAPGEREQMVKRCHRRGQTKTVNVKTLAVRGTVDQGVIELLHEKNKAIDFILKGLPLSDHAKLLLSDPSRLREYYERTPIGRYMYTSEQWAHMYIHRMSMRLAGKDEPVGAEGKKFRPVTKALEGTIGDKYAQSYTVDYEKGFQANLARAYKQIVEAIEQAEGKTRKVDIGSAFGVLSHALGDDSIVNVDLNPYHFKQPLAQGKTNVRADFTEMPFKDGSFDLAVCALTLHYASNNGRRSHALREANRILRDGGYYIIAENPGFISDAAAFNAGIKQHGFEIVPELTGFVKSTKPENMGLNAYVAVAKKVSSPTEQTDNKLISMSLDNRDPRLNKLRGFKRRGVAESFAFADESGETPLEDRLKMYREKYKRE